MKLLRHAALLLPLLAIQSTLATAQVLDSKQTTNLMLITAPRAINVSNTSKVFPSYKPSEIPFDFYKNNKEQVLGELANHDVSLRAYSIETDGKISYLVSFTAASKKKIVVQRDYLNYKIVDVDGKPKKIGVMFRIEAQLETAQANVDLSSLFAIGLAVKQGSASGQLRVQVHGLSGEPIGALIPSPSDISESSIQNAMECVAALKTKMYDSKVNVIPQELPD